MKRRICLFTRLHDGIYKSCGGGEVRRREDFAPTPRGLMAAARALSKELADARLYYGNMGCGQSWLELDGRKITDIDLMWIGSEDCTRHYLGSTRTALARKALALHALKIVEASCSS